MPLISANKNLQNNLTKEWEIDLELINLGVSLKDHSNNGKTTWSSPKLLREHDKEEFLLLYFVAVKGVLEDIFGIKIYEMITREDYYDIEKWRNAYNRSNLSMESFYHDIQKKMT